MLRVFFDTNALIDYVVASRPQHESVKKLIAAIAKNGDMPIILAASLKDVYYICCRHYGDEATARKAIRGLRAAFEVLNLSTKLIDMALDSDEPDFEDGLIRAAAESSGCSYIISRDVKAFRSSNCKRLSPIEALTEAYGGEAKSTGL